MQKERKALPVIVYVCVCVFFLYGSCLMMIVADPGGVKRAEPSLHYSTSMQPTHSERRIEWRGAL